MDTLIDVLFPQQLKGEPVHIILYGIGGFKTWNVADIEGTMENSYISEEAIFTLVAALQKGYQSFESQQMPRLVGIGTISISRQIYRSWNPLAAKVKPLYEWFMGKRRVHSEGIQCSPTDQDSDLSDTSSERTVTQLNYEGSHDKYYCNEKNDSDSVDGSNSSSDEQTSTDGTDAESMSSMAARCPHADKSFMEKAIWQDYHSFSSCLVVRPTLLTYDQPYGL
ncbi:hypothetical protein CDEST_13582 [Colletotrichum destructivum]|uniref:Uncharacterized protein n=1 Tax=Colletotrichum destructivum TaxID=34406 RepID=A0AAX4IZH2_9PEZI|nr:hypothetical protein CDEST_13582 [Colletotrichum destructivum]